MKDNITAEERRLIELEKEQALLKERVQRLESKVIALIYNPQTGGRP